MSNQTACHVFLQSNRIVLDAQALALATLLIAAAGGAAACGGDVAPPQPTANSSGGAPVIGPGICAVYASGGAAGSGVVTDSGFVAGVCPVFVDAAASGGASNQVLDASVGGSSAPYTTPAGGIC